MLASVSDMKLNLESDVVVTLTRKNGLSLIDFFSKFALSVSSVPEMVEAYFGQKCGLLPGSIPECCFKINK